MNAPRADPTSDPWIQTRRADPWARPPTPRSPGCRASTRGRTVATVLLAVGAITLRVFAAAAVVTARQGVELPARSFSARQIP